MDDTRHRRQSLTQYEQRYMDKLYRVTLRMSQREYTQLCRIADRYGVSISVVMRAGLKHISDGEGGGEDL